MQSSETDGGCGLTTSFCNLSFVKHNTKENKTEALFAIQVFEVCAKRLDSVFVVHLRQNDLSD